MKFPVMLDMYDMCSPELKVCVQKPDFSSLIFIFNIFRRKSSHEGQSLKNMKTGWYEPKMRDFFFQNEISTLKLRWSRPALVSRAR